MKLKAVQHVGIQLIYHPGTDKTQFCLASARLSSDDVGVNSCITGRNPCPIAQDDSCMTGNVVSADFLLVMQLFLAEELCWG